MIFVDTGAFIARYLVRDHYHDSAMKTWHSLRGETCMVSSFVLDELLTYTGRITGNLFIAEKVRIIYSSDSFQIVRPDAEQELAALRFFEKFADQQISYTDCVSFVLMNAHGLRKAFTFDRHFETAGFEIISDY